MPTFTNDEVFKYAHRIFEDMTFLQDAVTNNMSGKDSNDPVRKEYHHLLTELWTAHNKLGSQVARLKTACEQAEAEDNEHATNNNNNPLNHGHNSSSTSTTAVDGEASPRYEPTSPHDRHTHDPASPLPARSPSPVYQPTSPKYDPASHADQQQPTARPCYSIRLPVDHKDSSGSGSGSGSRPRSRSGFVDLTTTTTTPPPAGAARPQRPLVTTTIATGRARDSVGRFAKGLEELEEDENEEECKNDDDEEAIQFLGCRPASRKRRASAVQSSYDRRGTRSGSVRRRLF
ncbi:uncharacterized protein BKCO1_23000103 [Diplodia corticola]|uniref:Uncharacterized protein n=1 Tax=Diplodia corticola TaxID=236234 RepID=A0A1J9S1D8_9PEZI|nr:uncharacterized protein BKCO1_23000103 [Diplodia corticola]OJD34399.1 hypothetical protein BKCO1_23000103 [Diplodia corticola]